MGVSGCVGGDAHLGDPEVSDVRSLSSECVEICDQRVGVVSGVGRIGR